MGIPVIATKYTVAAGPGRPLAPRGLDLSNGILDRVEDEQGRGMTRLVVLDRLERSEIGPAALWRQSPLLQHFAHRGADGTKLGRGGADISRPMIADEDWPKRHAFTVWP